MNQGIPIFIGLVVAFLVTAWGSILRPLNTFGRQETVTVEMTGQIYPSRRPGMAQQGRDVYRSLGCASCHTQMVQPKSLSPDVARGWGARRSVAQDYIFDNPVMLGSVRIGPDLADVGTRISAEDPEQLAASRARQLLHLYDPRLVVPGSIMPPYPYLFDEAPSGGELPDGALMLPSGKSPKPGVAIKPTPDAEALVAYLESLQVTTSLFEAPIPLE